MNIANYHMDIFGDNMYIFSPRDNPAAVQDILDELWKKQETNQFGEERYGIYFLPGVYSPEISVKIGFYMQVAGLGALPGETVLKHVDCDAKWLRHTGNNNATCNFWRGAENLTVDHDMMFAVSQATFLRRVHIRGSLYLHDERGWASGGFLANSKIEKRTDSGTQQQWLSRNCDWQDWTGQNWNLVFSGIAGGKAPAGTWPETTFTTVPVTERIREKPFLAYDPGQGGFGVYVPPVRKNAVSFDWTPGSFLPLDRFYVAKAGLDDADSINAALQKGLHLLLTPGIYELHKPILLSGPDTVCLGIGFATLRSMNGNSCMEVIGNTPVTIAGILFDAGPAKTECLLLVGSQAPYNTYPAANPSPDRPLSEDTFTLLSDLFFRVGGVYEYDTNVSLCLKITQNHVAGDNFWIWRADHGKGVGWMKNRAKNGILVAGNDVILYALMVEHFQEYQTIWQGENGRVIFYQCEIPYDVPCQEVWQSQNGAINGYASYKIDDKVKSHEAWGLGIYLFNRDAAVELHHVMELPEQASQIRIHNICSVMITGKPGISHIINNMGGAVRTFNAREIITEYPVIQQ